VAIVLLVVFVPMFFSFLVGSGTKSNQSAASSSRAIPASAESAKTSAPIDRGAPEAPIFNPVYSSVAPQVVGSAASPVSNAAGNVSGWKYRHNDYEMGKGRVHTAVLESVNSVSFEFPYRGAQRGVLTVRTHPKYGKDVIFEIEKGQLLVRSYEDSSALVRFDDSDSIKYRVVGAEDHSTTSAFFQDYQGFVSRMMKSKRVRISIPVYHEGSPVFEFDVGGFDVNAYLEKDVKGSGSEELGR